MSEVDPFSTTTENAAVLGGAIDPMFAGAEDVAPAERNEGYQPLAAFGDYVFTIIKSEGRKFEKSGNSGLVVQAQIDEGPGDSAGQKTGYMNLLFFGTKHTDAKGNVLSDEDYTKKRKKNIATIKRVNVAAGLPENTFPSDIQSQAALDAYAAAFLNKKIIGRLEIEKTDQNRLQNRLVADSVEALGAQATERKGKERVKVLGKTALDMARVAIAAENAKAAGKSGTSGARKEGGPF